MGFGCLAILGLRCFCFVRIHLLGLVRSILIGPIVFRGMGCCRCLLGHLVLGRRYLLVRSVLPCRKGFLLRRLLRLLVVQMSLLSFLHSVQFVTVLPPLSKSKFPLDLFTCTSVGRKLWISVPVPVLVTKIPVGFCPCVFAVPVSYIAAVFCFRA